MSSEEDLSDSEIIDLFKKGQTEFYSILIERHYQRAYRIAFGILRSQEDAEEVVQDTFVKINRCLDSFRGDAQFTTWLFRIVTNFAKNKYRWNKSRRINVNISIDSPVRYADSELSFDIADLSENPGENTSFSELEKGLKELLKSVTPVYREVLIMRNIENKSYQEISEILEVKIGTIKSRIARGREELRALLDQNGYL